MLFDSSILGSSHSKENYEASISRLVSFQNKFPERVDIRLVETQISYSMLMIDPQSQSGEVQIELYTFSSITNDRPHFTLTHKQSPHWYEFYIHDFESAWINGKKINSRS